MGQDDETIDVVTGRVVKLRGNEKVRQQVARFLSVEYGIPVDDMARDCPIPTDAGGARRSVKKADLAELEALPGSGHTPQAWYGMWTNGLDFFFLHRESSRFGAKFEPRANWPIETSAGGALPSAVKMRRGEAAMLKTVFRRTHSEPGTRP